jgi:hypothetical protein
MARNPARQRVLRGLAGTSKDNPVSLAQLARSLERSVTVVRRHVKSLAASDKVMTSHDLQYDRAGPHRLRLWLPSEEELAGLAQAKQRSEAYDDRRRVAEILTRGLDPELARRVKVEPSWNEGYTVTLGCIDDTKVRAVLRQMSAWYLDKQAAG